MQTRRTPAQGRDRREPPLVVLVAVGAQEELPQLGFEDVEVERDARDCVQLRLSPHVVVGQWMVCERDAFTERVSPDQSIVTHLRQDERRAVMAATATATE